MYRFSKVIISLFLLVSISQEILATAQTPDFLIIEGDTISMFSNPLEDYFDENHPRPDGVFREQGYSTACWRGHIAYWELKNDSLFLLDLYGIKNKKIDKSRIFKDRDTQSEIFADWCSRKLMLAVGGIVYYIHDGYQSIPKYEKYLYFENGKLVKTETYDNSKTKASKYSKDERLRVNFVKNEINYNNIPEVKKRIRINIRFAGGEDGKPTDLVAVWNQSAYEKEGMSKADIDAYKKEALRVIEALPEWDVLYKKGELYKLSWTMPIIFLPKEDREK